MSKKPVFFLGEEVEHILKPEIYGIIHGVTQWSEHSGRNSEYCIQHINGVGDPVYSWFNESDLTYLQD